MSSTNETQILAFPVVSIIEGFSIAMLLFSSFWIERRIYTLYSLSSAFYITFTNVGVNNYIIKHLVYFK